MIATLEQAIALAAQAHAGQVDKAGAPYILHCLRVMLAVEGRDERIVAVLHDIIEDTAVTASYLRSMGFSETVIEAVVALTRLDGESYEAFIGRVHLNSLARTVKMADLRDNMDLSRFGREPTLEDHERNVKYASAWARLRQWT